MSEIENVLEEDAQEVILQKTGKIRVWAQYNFNPREKKEPITDYEEQTIEVNIFPANTKPATVGVGDAVKVDMGNYENVTCNYFVSVPCYVEEIDTAIDFCEKKVAERIGKKVKAMKELADKRGKK